MIHYYYAYVLQMKMCTSCGFVVCTLSHLRFIRVSTQLHFKWGVSFVVKIEILLQTAVVEYISLLV